LARNIGKELDANDYSFGHLTLILSIQYIVKFKRRSLAIYNNKFILDSARVGAEMINWKATNTIGNYCIPKSHTCHITFSLLQHVLSQNVLLQHECKWQTLTPLANSRLNNLHFTR